MPNSTIRVDSDLSPSNLPDSDLAFLQITAKMVMETNQAAFPLVAPPLN